MVHQSLLESISIPDLEHNSPLHFDSLDSFISYIYYLTSKNYSECNQLDYDSKLLKEFHSGKSVLKIDKYIGCAIPSVDLKFVLKSCDISNYSAYLDSNLNWKHAICNNEGVISEIFSPNISGDHYNPYIRFKSSISSSSRSCSRLMDLIGLEIYNVSEVDPHDNVFLEVVCTFPYIVDYYMINPKDRDNFIERMNLCRKKFFNRLNELFDCPESNVFGMSSSLHVWSSEIPILPNCHIHNFIPFFTYYHKQFVDRNDFHIEELSLMYPEWFENVFVEVPNGSKKVSSSKTLGSLDMKSTFVKEVQLLEKYVVDRGKYKELRTHISAHLKDFVNFSPCTWSSWNYPVDVDKLKDIWSDIVYDEFFDIMDNWELLDVHVDFIPWYKKHKIRSALQYKIRPPVLDLDLFFKKCSGVVTSYTDIDISKVLDYINTLLIVSVKCSDYDKINRYESLLKKAEDILGNHFIEDIYSWLQFLSVWVTDTRVYGFWKNLKHYLLDPEHQFLIVEEVCPICSGFLSDMGRDMKVKSCFVDFIMIQSKSKYHIYNVKGPPPPLFGVDIE